MAFRKQSELPATKRSHFKPSSKLERFSNRFTDRRYVIEIETPEFTCLCPASGYPDFAKILIRYIPQKWCVELKSLKGYFQSYRNEGIFHEDVTNLICDHLVGLLDPWELEVTGNFNARGNITTVVRSRYSHSKNDASMVSLLKEQRKTSL